MNPGGTKETLLPVVGGPLHNTETVDRGDEWSREIGGTRYVYGRATVTVEAPCVFRGVRSVFRTRESGYRLVRTERLATEGAIP
jgi:hypothetical protein